MKIHSKRMKIHRVKFVFAAIAAALAAAQPAAAETRAVVGVTETVSSYNPHGDSISMGYGIWCQVYGCLGTYDFSKGEYVGMLAERWEVDEDDPRIWTFHLKEGMKRQKDGHELTAEDVVHSFWRIRNDPQTRQTQNLRPVDKIEAVDDYTVRVTTKQPTAPLLEYLFDRVMITGKDLYEKHGAKTADREYPLGWGPYMLEDIKIGQYMVLRKWSDHPDTKSANPDRLMFRIMREAEQRATALTNNEVQIAQFIPPHLAPRVEQSPNADIVPTSSVEIMFLAMSPKFEPWNDVNLRRAVCHAVNRDVIIKVVLNGQAERLDGPIGPGQYGYDPEAAKEMSIPYDPEKAKELLAKSDYKGQQVELQTPVGRYVNDKQVTEAMIPMLKEVGINAVLRTPEWPRLWANVQKGRTPFYYMGRGSVVDPSVAFSQYFETGVSPRIAFSDEQVDALLKKERATFDPEKRKETLNGAFKRIVDQAPACFMWRHKLLYGIAKNINYKPLPTGRIFGTDITVK